MKQQLRIHSERLEKSLSALIAIVAITVIVAYLSPDSNMISTYYGIGPGIIVFTAMFMASGASTVQLESALAAGSSRRAFFGGLQMVACIYAAFGMFAMVVLQLCCPTYLRETLIMAMDPLTMGVVTYALFFVGGVMGMVLAENKKAGPTLVTLLILALLASSTLSTMVLEDTAQLVQMFPMIMAGALVVTIPAQLILWKQIHRDIQG